MTDIRERVARAMYRDAFCRNGEDDDWLEAPQEIRDNMMSGADAALAACGYQEMKEALENIALHEKASGSDALKLQSIYEFARAALAKANPGGTGS